MQIQPNIFSIKQQLEEITHNSVEDELVPAIANILNHLLQFDGPETQQNRRRSDQSMLPDNFSELGDECIQYMEQLAANVKPNNPDKARQVELLSFPLALWLTQHGGELKTLTPVVNAIAYHSNQNSQVDVLERLYHMVDHILEGICPRALQADQGENAKAWRVLLLNHGIIATRTHNAILIEDAYQNLAEKIPEDAAHFFEQGMAQMVRINYPDHVKSIVQKYYTQWHQTKVLH